MITSDFFLLEHDLDTEFLKKICSIFDSDFSKFCYFVAESRDTSYSKVKSELKLPAEPNSLVSLLQGNNFVYCN